MVLLGKIMILQGVGHQISCLGVCYANGPQKGGYTTPTCALDLTTSLRGDFSSGTKGESLHCALLLDYVPPKEPLGTPLGNTLRIKRPKLDWRGP